MFYHLAGLQQSSYPQSDEKGCECRTVSSRSCLSERMWRERSARGFVYTGDYLISMSSRKRGQRGFTSLSRRKRASRKPHCYDTDTINTRDTGGAYCQPTCIFLYSGGKQQVGSFVCNRLSGCVIALTTHFPIIYMYSIYTECSHVLTATM